MIVMIIAILVFKIYWMDLPELKIPTTYFQDEYKFGSGTGFVTKMKILILDIQNHDYWIKNVGFDGQIIRLLLFAFS